MTQGPTIRAVVLGIALTGGAGIARPAAAQTPPSPPPPAQVTTPAEPDKPMTWKDRLKEPDQAGGLHFTEHWAVAFGGIKQGSGVGAGPAFSTRFANGGFMQLKAVISIRNFKLLQARYDSRTFWNDRAIVVSRLRWHDAPAVKLYALGPDSSDTHIDYEEHRTEASTQLVVRMRPAVRVAGGFGVERFRTRADRVNELLVNTDLAALGLSTLPPPGLGARPLFAHGFGTLGYDTRLSPDYTRRGRFLEAQIHGYSDVDGSEDSFGRVEGAAEQYIPTHGERGVIGLAARTWLSVAEGARSVPFYLTPTLGGGDLLRAYPSYRFRDRHALLLLAQYRWAVHKLVDLAGTYEAGKVAPTLDGLDFDNMAHSIAAGVRVHSKKSGLVRADMAYGREGVGFRIGFSAGG
jgi:hypothetical protein